MTKSMLSTPRKLEKWEKQERWLLGFSINEWMPHWANFSVNWKIVNKNQVKTWVVVLNRIGKTPIDQDNVIVRQTLSMFGKLKKFVSIFYTGAKAFICKKLEKFVATSFIGAIFPWMEKIIRPNIKIYWNETCEGVRPNICRRGPFGCIRPNPMIFWASRMY